MKSKFTLAIDIGNTRTHLGIIDMEHLQCVASRFVLSDVFREQVVSTVLDIFERHDKSFCAQIVISSVIKKMAEITRVKLEELFPEHVRIARFSPSLPFQCKYKKPEHLGTDRIANALYGFTTNPGKNVIMASAGTAITIDLLHDGEFAGGAILPGVRTQFNSLKLSTDALPEMSTDEIGETVILPGMSTDECIVAGVIYGAASATDRIVNELNVVAGGDCILLGTGGDWGLLSKYLMSDFCAIPDMTMIGTALFVNYM